MNKLEIKEKANLLLKKIYGPDAGFREGQYEAIESALLGERTLVVQKTGWGKSLVYFMCTRMLREQGKGIAFVISPLLVLMENQTAAATSMGLKCEMLNSKTKERRSIIINEMKKNNIDLVFITPETLQRTDIQEALKEVNIGLFVIDEVHCISDWGHDFRKEYMEIHKILDFLPSNIPVIATTATANNRVIKDLEIQLGSNVYVSRGNLMRDNLYIQVLPLKTAVERYAWILENINKFEGSGIIYCLTTKDCLYLEKFLRMNGINAMSYFSRNEKEEYLNIEAEEKFQKNEIKVIVATIKLGMGYDKGDISFVIHYQQPSNIISYYQQIGRAGRNIELAETFLMVGIEDVDIQNHFINTAFPKESEFINVLNYINSKAGVSLSAIQCAMNYRRNKTEQVVEFLEKEEYIYKEGYHYYRTIKEFKYNKEKYEKITQIRKDEQEEFIEYTKTSECYNKVIVNNLNCYPEHSCGVCRNCLGYDKYSSKVSEDAIKKAIESREKILLPILPRKIIPKTNYNDKITIKKPNEEGICLAKYGEPEYGLLVKKEKYGNNEEFSSKLIDKTVSVLKNIIIKENIEAITYVPSLRSEIVKNFANQVSEKLGIPCMNLIDKTEGRKQKELDGSIYQCENAIKTFHIKKMLIIPKKVILIDDIVDSKWTLTICGYLLTENGVNKVFPFALADSSSKKDE